MVSGLSVTYYGRRKRIREIANKLHGDGCSLSPDLWFKLACDEHDIEYRERRKLDDQGNVNGPAWKWGADARLWKNIKNSSPILPYGLKWLSPTAAIYYVMVTLFGWSAWVKGPEKLMETRKESV